MTIKISTLDNGLRVATNEINDIDSISIIILVRVGSRNESKELNGITHFLEHMAFKGTKTRTANMIAEEFDSIGGYFNAYTSRENTVYSVKVLKDDYKKAIDILADILQNSIFDASEIEKELNVITQEIAAAIDAPDDIIFDNWQEVTYPDQAFGRPILGKIDTISKLKREDFINYINQYYTYENIIISTVGDIEHQEILQIIEDKFILLSNSNKESLDLVKYHPDFNYKNRKLEQSHLVIGFDSCSYLSDKIYPLHLFATIFGGGLSSRLYQEVREKRGLCYSIESFFSAYHDCGNFMIYTAAEDNNITDIIEIIAEQMKDLASNLNQIELDRAFTHIKANILMSNENYLYKAEEIAKSILYYGRYISNEENINLLKSVTQDYIKDLIHNLLSSAPSIALIGKKDLSNQYSKIKSLFA